MTTLPIRSLVALVPLALWVQASCATTTASLTPQSPHVAVVDASQERVADLAREDGHAMEYLDHLVNRIGPRLSGSHGMEDAVEWSRERFEELGLSDVHLERCGEVPVGFDRGPSSGRVLTPAERDLHFSTPAWTAGTRGRQRARALAVPAAAIDMAAWLAQAEGAWVLWQPDDDPDANAEFLRAWESASGTHAGLVAPSSGKLIHTFGDHRVDFDDLPATPRIVLLQEEFEQLTAWLAEGEAVELEFDIRNHFSRGPVPLYNVVADLPGTDLADEYVIVGAHLDSLDGATGATDNGTGVAAVLEAARLLSEAGARPRRTIRFLLFAGEETGLVGSSAYVRDHPELVPRISAVLNMDQGPAPIAGIQSTADMRAELEEAFAPVLALDAGLPFEIQEVERLPSLVQCGASDAAADPLSSSSCGGQQAVFLSAEDALGGAGCSSSGDCGTPIVIRRRAGVEDGAIPAGAEARRVVVAMGSSDHAPFLRAGAPAFLWIQKAPEPLPYPLHTQLDTYDRVEPRYLQHSATVIALGALGIADLDRMLPKPEPTEGDSLQELSFDLDLPGGGQ